MNDSERDEDRLPQLGGMRLEREPERDLWPQIAARIAPRRRHAAWTWTGYAAAAGIVGAVALQLWPEARPLPEVGSVPATRTAFADPQPVTRWVMPQQQALLKANLAIVKDAESQLRHALEQDPDSAALRRLLGSMEQRRGDLKNRLAQET